jgi:2-methylcitrate dehydratase PrpD
MTDRCHREAAQAAANGEALAKDSARRALVRTSRFRLKSRLRCNFRFAMQSHTPTRAGGTAALASFASKLGFADIPRDVIVKARLCVLDTLGCCVYGSTLAPVAKLAAMVMEEGARPIASIFGTAHRTSPADAALVNATAAHAFQLDEVHTGSTLHPGSVVVPAAIAMSERAGGVSGEEFMAAMIAGYEVGIRVGAASQGGMFRRGYHNQGTTGCVAAAAAAGRVLGLDATRMMHALGIAASQAAGLMAVQEGANAKAFHSGRAAQSGVYAALLAADGYTGVEDVFDVDYGGFFSTLVESHSPDALTDGLGARWETLKVGYKVSPASNGSITAMDTLDRIMKKNGLTAEDLERITASVSTNTLEHCGWAFDPAAMKGVLAAQMNLRYGLAAMAIDRAATPAQYQEERIKRADVAAFLPRIDVNVEPHYDSDPGLRLACRLHVRTRSGQTFTDETLYRRGGPEDPLTAEDLERKFMMLATAALPETRARAWLDYVGSLEKRERIALPE